MLPWWKRLGGFVADVKVFIGICVATLAAHAWIKGLITRAELDLAVKAEVATQVKEALREVRVDLDIIKTNTGGIKEWRGATTEKLIGLERDSANAANEAKKANDRIDSYLVTVRIHR